jgi:hypothetical protein
LARDEGSGTDELDPAVETAGQVEFVQGYERHVAERDRTSARVSP